MSANVSAPPALPRHDLLKLNAPSAALLALTCLLALIAVSCSLLDRRHGQGGDFPITTYQGAGVITDAETTLESVLAQGKPVVLNFWAGDCPPCVTEMPVLEEAWQEFGGDVVVLGVDIGPLVGLGTYESGQRLLHDSGVTYPAGKSSDFALLDDFGLTGLPATFFITPDGEINDRWHGMIAYGPLQVRMTDLLEKG